MIVNQSPIWVNKIIQNIVCMKTEKSAPWLPKLQRGGVTQIWAMPKFKLFFLVVPSLTEMLFVTMFDYV